MREQEHEYLEGEEEEGGEIYLDENEAQEELELGDNQVLPEDDTEMMMEDSDLQDGEGEGEGDGGVGGQENFEFKDDSVQGFFEHKEPVFSVAFHPTIAIAASGGGDDKSYLWSLETGDKLFDLGVHGDSCCQVAFSADGKYLASAGLDGKLFIFAIQDSHTDASVALVQSLEGPSEISWIEWHPRGNVILAAGEDGTVWMWQIPSGTCMNVFTGHADSVTCGQWTKDGKNIVTGSSDGTIIVWDPKTGAAIHKWTGNDGRFHQAPVTSIGVNKDSNVIVSGDQSGSVLMLQIGSSEKILGSLEKHQESVETIQFSNSLPYVATGGVDGMIHVWDVSANILRYNLSHEDAVTKIRWNPYNSDLISSSTDCTLKIWDGRTGELKRSLSGHQNGILDFDIRSDGSIALTGSDDGNCLVFPLIL